MRWGRYVRDDGVTAHAKLVDADEITDPARGWTQTAVGALSIFPRKARPRRVYGTSPTTGRRGRTVVASAGAPLWTGTETMFFIETNEGGIDTIKVTFRRGEHFVQAHL